MYQAMIFRTGKLIYPILLLDILQTGAIILVIFEITESTVWFGAYD